MARLGRIGVTKAGPGRSPPRVDFPRGATVPRPRSRSGRPIEFSIGLSIHPTPRRCEGNP
eukprot:1100857-Amphidinium_carterae.1